MNNEKYDSFTFCITFNSFASKFTVSNFYFLLFCWRLKFLTLRSNMTCDWNVYGFHFIKPYVTDNKLVVEQRQHFLRFSKTFKRFVVFFFYLLQINFGSNIQMERWSSSLVKMNMKCSGHGDDIWSSIGSGNHENRPGQKGQGKNIYEVNVFFGSVNRGWMWGGWYSCDSASRSAQVVIIRVCHPMLANFSFECWEFAWKFAVRNWYGHWVFILTISKVGNLESK